MSRYLLLIVIKENTHATGTVTYSYLGSMIILIGTYQKSTLLRGTVKLKK